MTAKGKRKRLGQHFLTDSQVIDQIVRLINPAADDIMVEIGPGKGALTERLIGRTRVLHAIEVDPQLAQGLQKHTSSDRFTVHHADALNCDFRSFQTDDSKIRVVGNLPYSISTALIIRLLDFSDCIQDLCFMLQREVAERLSAACGTRQYGRLTVCVARSMEVETVFDVPPGAFSPPPEVQSTVVYMRPRPMQDADSSITREFEELVRLAFCNRRKTLRNSLQGVVDRDIFQECGVDSGLRAQELDVGHYWRLAECLTSRHYNKIETI